jgi:putative phage-type endonuclease
MRIHNLVQGSGEWLAFRNKGIGASDIPVIMGESPYQKIGELFLQKIGELSPTKQNFAMKKGHDAEPFIRNRFKQIMGDDYEPMVVSSEVFPWAFASLDGRHEGPRDSAICEIKVVGKSVYDECILGNIPHHHMLQIQWQLFVSEADVAFHVAFLDNEHDLVITEIKRDAVLINNIYLNAQWFYNCMITRTPPEDPISEELITLIEDYEKIELKIKKLTELQDELKGIIKDICPRDKTLNWGRTTCAWRSRAGSIDYKSIDAIKGLDLDKYRKPSIEYFEVRVK